MTKRVLVLGGLLAACGSTPHDVRVEVDGIPNTAAKIVVSLALGNDDAPDLVYPITSYDATETLVVSLPKRAGWISATITAQDANACDLAIGAGGIGNDFSGKVDDVAVALFPAVTTPCGLHHTPGMVSFEAGNYVLGCDLASDPDCTAYESPQTTVALGAFELDATEVTVGAYRDCMNDGGACPPPIAYTPPLGLSDDAAQDGLTWAAASDFCVWARKALPTEAQWEAAMRGPEGRLYPWGSASPTCAFANFYDNLAGQSCVPVGPDLFDERRYVPGLTPLGIADAGGNVSEWVADYYAERSSLDSATLVTGPTSGTQHVAKGGSFVELAQDLRGASRVAYDPDGTGPAPDIPKGLNLGVRCGLARH